MHRDERGPVGCQPAGLRRSCPVPRPSTCWCRQSLVLCPPPLCTGLGCLMGLRAVGDCSTLIRWSVWLLPWRCPGVPSSQLHVRRHRPSPQAWRRLGWRLAPPRLVPCCFAPAVRSRRHRRLAASEGVALEGRSLCCCPRRRAVPSLLLLRRVALCACLGSLPRPRPRRCRSASAACPAGRRRDGLAPLPWDGRGPLFAAHRLPPLDLASALPRGPRRLPGCDCGVAGTLQLSR